MMLPAAVILTALLQASALSGLPIPAGTVPPAVFTTETAFGEKLSASGTMGATDMRTGWIALHAAWHNDTYGHCVLVHELTHYLQVVNQVVLKPVELNEPQAWYVTAKCFLAEHQPALATWAFARRDAYLTHVRLN